MAGRFVCRIIKKTDLNTVFRISLGRTMVSSPYVCTDRLAGDQQCFYCHLFFWRRNRSRLQSPSTEIPLVIPSGKESHFSWTHNQRIIEPGKSLIVSTLVIGTFSCPIQSLSLSDEQQIFELLVVCELLSTSLLMKTVFTFAYD
jgi:hypothetical protein